MKEKRKSYRERYFEDYKAVKVAAKNQKGYRMEYHYVGHWMQWESERHPLRQVKLLLAAAEILSIVAYVAAILSRSPFTLSRLANGFGTVSLIPWMLEVSGVARFVFSGEYVKELEREEIDRSIRAGCLIRMLFAAASAVAGVADILTRGTASPMDIPVVLTILLSAAISMTIRICFGRLLVATYRNENGRPGSRM